MVQRVQSVAKPTEPTEPTIYISTLFLVVQIEYLRISLIRSPSTYPADPRPANRIGPALAAAPTPVSHFTGRSS